VNANVNRNDLLIRASLAQNAVLDGLIRRFTVAGDEVAVMWQHLDEHPEVKVTDLAIAGARVAGSAVRWVLAEFGTDAATRMVKDMQQVMIDDLAIAARMAGQLEQGNEAQDRG
jgi:hypothetical protein